MLASERVHRSSGPRGVRPAPLASGADAFARALRDGLADLAYVYDGEFRPRDSLSAAERAAYGLHGGPTAMPASSRTARRPASPIATARANGDAHPSATSSFVPAPRSRQALDASSSRTAPSEASLPVCATRAYAPRAAGAVIAGQRPRTARWARIRATAGAERIDVIVASGRHANRVFAWMR